jgi:REP element-mobilizing transposase RayT
VLDVVTKLSDRYTVEISASVLMPDHLHLILWIESSASTLALRQIIGAFMSLAWRQVRDATGDPGPLWQRGCHDRVVRSDGEFERSHAYIAENPLRWLARQDD